MEKRHLRSLISSSPWFDSRSRNQQQKADMKVKTLSRGPSIDTEHCVEMVGGNRFNLVLIAAARSRELAKKHKNAELGTQLNAPVSALLDIQNGLVGVEYLRKV